MSTPSSAGQSHDSLLGLPQPLHLSLSQMQPLGLKLSVFTTVLGVPWGHSLSLTHSGAPALSELRVEHIVGLSGWMC